MVSNYSDAGQERWLAGKGIDLLRGTGRLAGTGVVEVDGVRHTAEHVVVATGSDPIVPPVPGLRELEGVWRHPRGDEHEGGPAAAARAGWRAGRASSWRRSCGVSAARRCSSRAPTACFPVSRRRWARRSARPCAGTASSSMLGMHATAARRDGDEYVLQFDGGTRVAGRPSARGDRSAPPRRGDRPGDGRRRGRPAAGSRSTSTCAPASASGRSATSPASGR